jgi:MFS family permease
MWYKKTEQPLRIAFWYAASGFGGCAGSLASWGIGHISGSLRPWQYQYLILGAVTVVWGLGMIRFLPDNPIQARFLSDRERILAVERMRAGQTGIENSHFKLYQAKEALLDIKTWLMVLMVFCTHLVNAAVTGFGSIIVSGFGFSPLTSVLLLESSE